MFMTKKSILRSAPKLACLGLCIALSACNATDGSSNGSTGDLEPLDILIDWQAEPTYLGIFFAIEQGYLREVGYDAKVTQSWGANQAVAAVAAGQNVLGTASGGATILGRNNDAQVVSTAVLYPRIPTVVYGLATSGIQAPADLKGRKVGLYPGSITNNEFDAFLKLNGMSRDDMEIVSLSGADIPLLVSGQVDAVLHYTEMSPVLVETSGEIAGQQGERTFELSLSDFGVGGYGLNIIANPAALEKDPERLAAATDAIVRGYVDGCANRDEAVASFVSQFPDKEPDYVASSWDKVCDLLGPQPGAQNNQGWEETIALYRDLGLLTVDVTAPQIINR
jgi:ABC-type nitrate/sulfonate/bicarbonate transport system substrate-binding protein